MNFGAVAVVTVVVRDMELISSVNLVKKVKRINFGNMVLSN